MRRRLLPYLGAIVAEWIAGALYIASLRLVVLSERLTGEASPLISLFAAVEPDPRRSGFGGEGGAGLAASAPPDPR